MAEIHVNMKQLNKWKVYSDNVIAYDQIIQSKGKFFTDRPEIYTRWLDEYGIFYTLKGAEKEIRKANPAPRKRASQLDVKSSAATILLRCHLGQGYSAGPEFPGATIRKAIDKLFSFGYLGEDTHGRMFITNEGRDYLNKNHLLIDTRKANPAPRKRAAKKSGAEADYEAFAASVKKNLAKRAPSARVGKTRKQYVSRPSQAPGHKAPSKRLQARRKKALNAPQGYFPNPLEAGVSSGKADQSKFPYHVQYMNQYSKWVSIGAFVHRADAFEYAKSAAKMDAELSFRVMKDE